MNKPQPLSWLWQSPAWPTLGFNHEALGAALARARLEQGILIGKAQAMAGQGLARALRETWSGDAVATAAIEGETIDIAAVRSSVARRLGIAPDFAAAVPRSVEGLLDVMEDAAAGWDTDLTHERLCRWQGALFPAGHSLLRPVATGRYREHDEPMQIVSGPLGKETVHYEAPPSREVPREMSRFLEWFNRTRADASMDGIARAGIAHAWFETIHPFEDGNGRVGRAIVDMALAQSVRLPHRLHGVSAAMRARQAQYYEELNRAQRGTGDVTPWLAWFIETFIESCRGAARLLDESIARARFWAEHSNTPLNERQRKALDRMLEAGPGNFEGGMTVRKYRALTGASSATASRDLADLAAAGLLARAGAGRSTRYDIAIPGWAWNPK
jgi:Fic family protein